MVDPITEVDLIAYVDGQLDAMRRVEVEAHLARHPDDAARVMADMRDRDALREAFVSVPGKTPDQLQSNARRLDRSFAWQRAGARLRRAAAIVVLVGAGWLAHTEIGTFGVPDTFASTVDPTLVEDANRARQAARIRARTASQRATPAYDRSDLEAATGLNLPNLPADWVVRDVQVFPGRISAGVEVSIDAGKLGDISLFATRSSSPAAARREVTEASGGTVAYWQAGSTAYALSGVQGGTGLQAAASGLASQNR